jgi:hypothetical protein
MDEKELESMQGYWDHIRSSVTILEKGEKVAGLAASELENITLLDRARALPNRAAYDGSKTNLYH